jgi:hypothetical protein
VYLCVSGAGVLGAVPRPADHRPEAAARIHPRLINQLQYKEKIYLKCLFRGQLTFYRLPAQRQPLVLEQVQEPFEKASIIPFFASVEQAGSSNLVTWTLLFFERDYFDASGDRLLCSLHLFDNLRMREASGYVYMHEQLALRSEHARTLTHV